MPFEEHDSSLDSMIFQDNGSNNENILGSVENTSEDNGLAQDHESRHSSSQGDDYTFEIDALFERPSSECLMMNNNNSTEDTPQFSVSEICSYQLMSLLDEAGCPLNTYEKVIALLRQQERIGFSVNKAYSRQKLLHVLRQKYHCPIIKSFTVNNCEVFCFPFVYMLQDLLDTAGGHLHHILPSFQDNTTSPWHDELWNTSWMNKTFQQPLYSNFNVDKDIMLPIILYIDKTGTDVLQRYSLEPVLFTVAALSRESREN